MAVDCMLAKKDLITKYKYILPDLEEVSVYIFSLVSDLAEDKLPILDIDILHSFPMLSQNFSKVLKQKEMTKLSLSLPATTFIISSSRLLIKQ